MVYFTKNGEKKAVKITFLQPPHAKTTTIQTFYWDFKIILQYCYITQRGLFLQY